MAIGDAEQPFEAIGGVDGMSEDDASTRITAGMRGMATRRFALVHAHASMHVHLHMA